MGLLIYQITLLTKQYLSGKTVVSLYVGRLHNVALPAFTICTPNILSMEKASRMRPEFSKIYQEYEELNDQLKYLPNHNPENSSESKRIIREMNKLYHQVNKQIDLSTIPVYEILNNWTVSFDKKYIFFEMLFEGVYRNGSEIKTKFNTDEIQLNPIESLKLKWSLWGEIQTFECFTFFSSLNEQWRDFQMNLDRITIMELMSHYKWIPPTERDTFYFAVHSPNTIPDLTDENFVEIRNDHFYLFYYSQLNIERLDSNYETNCYAYDIDHKHANFNMRSDCMTSCYQTLMRKKCNQSGSFISANKLLRSQYIENNPTWLFNKEHKCPEQHHIELKSTCKLECKYDCSFKYYLLEKYENNFNEFKDSFNLTIQRNIIPDVIIQYLPQTSFISFVCNFGGLLGMWLGLSIFAIFDDVLGGIIGFIRRPNFYLNKIQFNHFTNNIVFVNQNIQNFEQNDPQNFQPRQIENIRRR